ncbi:neurocan core protein-like [Homalodisca vitripennis]|uniref:neurocan core protein-like n=1 Tax=Homalodisca vitripennis TaxID=197043 RepID=UPI001EEA5260|nr:neurocan core protein-like [Homalodisca vitripennis]XP_046675557.1 neurocan core protein-like [Homalodisca vitripennis]
MTEKTSLFVWCSVLTVGSVLGQNNESQLQCITNEDCSELTTCINLQCEDPCLNLCKGNSNCQVRGHVPYCSCKPGFAGDPFTGCNQRISALAQCETNEDCPRDRVCARKKCEDPCLGVCGYNSTCQVLDHVPYCSCRPGFYGDPFSKCNRQYRPGSWPPFPDARKRYQVEAIKTNWFGAFAQCMNHGGRLAVILTKEENDKVKEEILRSGLRPQFWLGGTDYPLGNHWTWMSTGKPFTFTDWHNNQPDNWQNRPGGEHCLEFWETESLRWNDRNCLDELYSICEYYDSDDSSYDVNWRLGEGRR